MSVDAGPHQLKVIRRGKTVAGSEFQSLEVIGIKELVKALIRFYPIRQQRGPAERSKTSCF